MTDLTRQAYNIDASQFNNIRVIELDSETDDDDLKYRIINILDKKDCAGRCGKSGRYRRSTRTYVCKKCTQTNPYQKLITRTKVIKTYGLTAKQLINAYKAGVIHMFTQPNPINPRAPPMRLYYQGEIEDLINVLNQ